MALPQDETTTEQPSIDYEALGLEPVEEEDVFGGGIDTEVAEATKPVSGEIDYEGLGLEPVEEEGVFTPSQQDAIPVTGEEGFLRQAADVPLKIGESINSSLKGLTDLFGADNAISQNLSQNADWYRSLLSAQALEDEQEVGRILQEAENKGILDQLGAGLEAFSVAPIDFVASGIGSLATFAATGVAGRAAAVAGAARAGLTGAKAAQFVQRGVQATQLATGAAMGAGIVKGEIYQSVKDEMLAQGKTEEESKRIATEAQSYMGKNLDQILLGAGLGTIDAFTGAEKIIGKVLTKGGLKPDASRIGNIIKNGITEAAPEFVQAAQEKFASNLALQREGVDVSLTQGVFSQGALEGLVGLGLGVGAGAIEPRIQTPPTKEEVSAAAAETQDVARRSMDVAPATASLVEGEAEQIVQSQAETPDQRIARLQEEATAAAGIELEEEGGGGVEPTVPVTPPVTPTPEGAVAPVEPVVEPVVAEPQPAAEVAPIPQIAPAEVEPQVAAQKAIDASRLSGRRLGIGRASESVEQAREVAYEAKQEASLSKTPVEKAIQIWEAAGNETKYGEPEFASSDLSFAVSGGYDKTTNEVKLTNNPREFSSLTGDAALTPRSVVRHELGHWALFNAADNDLVRRLFEWADTADRTEILDSWHGGKAGIAYPKTKFDSRDELVSEAYSIWKSGGTVPEAVIPMLQELDALVPEQLQNKAIQFADSHATKLGVAPAVTPPAEVVPEVTPIPETPNLEPLRRVARAEQAPEDVPSLVGAGLVEVYKDQPVITESGFAALPEAERPRLTPEARKIQIDTGSNEVVAEAISKNLRIGVDQVGPNVTLPAGWTLDGDIYVPPTPQEVGEEVTVYRGELPALEGGRQLAGIRDFGELVGLPDDVALAPFTYYSTSEQDARAYLERDARILKDYQDRFGEEEGMKMFQSLHGFDPRTEGQVVSKKIRPRKVFDITEMGTTADFSKMYELVAKEMGYTLPENWRWKDVPKEVTDEVNRYGLDIVGDPDEKQPTWQYFRNDMDRTRAALIQRGLSERTKEDVRGSLFAQWLRKNGYDAVAMMHDTDAGPVKHILVINEDAAKAQENLVPPEVVPEVVPPRPPDTDPEIAAQQEIQSIVDKYQTSEPVARMILSNQNFEAKEAGVIPEGWVVENIDGQNLALSPVWQKSRRDVQVAIRKLTTLERGALSARLSKEGLVNEEQAKEYLSQAIRRSSEERVAAAEAEANERFDALVEGIIRENRSNVSEAVTDVSKPTVDLESEEQTRAEKPSVDPSSVLDPNEIEFMSARQALKLLAEANIIHKGYEGFEGTGDADAQGNALWRTTGNVTKPLYVRLQEAASVLAKTNLRGLDAERINISGRTSGRAYRSWGGDIFIPRTQGGTTAFLEPWILLHEVGHTLTADALRKYVVQREATGEEYYKRLKKTLADKSVPKEVRRAVKLYVDTIKALNIEKEYFKKNGLAGDGDRGIRNASARELRKIVNPFTGKEITKDDMYALSDIHEFYAQAWNSDSFQDILKQIKVEPQRSAFQKFVDVIKDILGFDSNTMAYAVIDTSLRLASLEVETDKGSTVEQRIKSTKELRAVKELPRTKTQWTGFSGKYSSDRVKMSRNKFSKLGYDQIRFHVEKSGRNEWRLHAEISQSYKAGNKSNVILPNAEIFVRWLDSRASAQEFAERLASDVNGLIGEKYGSLNKNAPQAPIPRGKPSPKPLLSLAPEPEGREIPQPTVPTFSEGSPEASTLSTMAASMAKVDAASEGKPNPENKPTYKISEIASVWMDQGGDARQLQDLISENTLLSPANAKKVANAIAKQYDIQQSIKTAFLETPAGVSVEALPEGVTLPKEVDPDRPRPVMQRLFDVFMGVRVPPVKIEVNEKTALKDQIRLKAAANRAAKAEQKRTAEEVVEIIKAMELLGPVRPKQVQALAKRAARVIWTSEKSVEAFSEYAAKVVENANYDADLRAAKDAQKRAKQLSTQKKVAMSPQRQILEDVGKVPVNKLDDPRMFAEAVNYYLRGFKGVLSPDYVVIPDAEMESYLSGAQSETQRNQRDLDREANKRLAEKYGIDPDLVNEMMESFDILRQIEAQENREALENLLTEKAIETQQGLNGYDTDNLQADQRPIVAAMLKIDPKALDPEERQRFIRITNNIIYNNQTNGAEYFMAVAKGQQSAREAAQDSEMIAKNRAWINLLPRFISERMQRGWALELQSVADTFRNAFGKGAMAKVYDAIGMLDLNLGFTKANNTIDEIQEKIAEFHRNLEKKYKAAARNQDGLLAEGVVGFLIQSVPKKDEVTSINQRRDLIRQDIANRRRATGEPDKVAMADRIEAILNRIDGESVDAILKNMKREFPANHESLVWYKDILLPQYKDFLKSFDENFNDQANNYDNPNYLTIGFTSAGPSLAITPEEQSLFYDQVSLRPKQSAYTIKRVDYTKIPDGKEIEFNLRRNVFNSLSDQINKAYTSSGWQRIASFMKTPEAEVVFGGSTNKDFFIERLNRLRLSRMRRGSMGSGGAIEKAVDSLSIISRKLGTGIALGGIYQWIKQPPDQLITALGSGGRYDLLAKNIAPSTQKKARELLNKFSIGRRGDASSGYKYINQMEGHQNRLERYFSESKWDQAKEQAGKVADVWMVALKSSDFLAASAAWMTYYEGELNKQNIKIDDWAKEAELIESDPKRRQAAAFAEQMTDIYQGSSDPTSMATFAQSGKTGWENLVKAIFVPFNSFAIQQRMRLYSDARDAINGSKGGKGGLAGTIGGLILFHATKRYVIPAISGAGIGILYGLMGVDMDEPDEEKQKEEANKKWRQFLADITGNLLVGGTPQIVESQFIDAMNRASYLVSLQLENDSILNDEGEIMSYDQYSKERSPFYRYKSFDNAMSLGMLEIGLGQAEQVALQTKMLATPEEMEMYTPEEQRLLYFSALSEWLYLMRLNDADFARLVSKARRDMIKAAEEREKELKRIQSGR